ncbi:uncharacterized protein LOC132621734 [Lycium barbarum]|uniref:uncharacterized protein LOC132621734 n=1 Tax=Lycium barbarum TaxID=112863 RepID=UPI00293EAA57|nr:uncharacterized protein LOC132621734 [Lycium barbarum]
MLSTFIFHLLESISTFKGGVSSYSATQHKLAEEQMEERWLESVGGPTRFGTAYGMPHRAFRQYRSPLEGLHSSNTESFDRVRAMAMEQKISELSSQLQASEERERRKDMQFDGMRAQLDALLASRGIPSCADDARNPHTQSSGADDDRTHVSNTQRHA